MVFQAIIGDMIVDCLPDMVHDIVDDRRNVR